MNLDTRRIKAYVVTGGRYHDFDFARLRLLEHLSANPRIQTKVGHDYSDLASLTESDFLITYTCDVRPSPEQQNALADFVAAGGRWFALHATNAILERGSHGMSTPPMLGKVASVLGSRFLSHPPVEPYRVEIDTPEHPLVRGIEPFQTADELYLSERFDEDEHTVLMSTRWTGDTGEGKFEHRYWPHDETRPVMYLRPYGAGEVLYLTLGHSRGHYDMQPETEYCPDVQSGSWDLPEFIELVRRGIHWAAGELSESV